MQSNDDLENFSTNLQFLCGFYSSISEVCRRLEINRQQFNRYLNGKAFPSFKNLKKICDFLVWRAKRSLNCRRCFSPEYHRRIR
ncbi:helix-turn-helix transcriptional regulator [Aliamphritea spongicola]|nr:helix-turn-helix transcriptional regulator [Aliamphritea spongicola]